MKQALKRPYRMIFWVRKFFSVSIELTLDKIVVGIPMLWKVRNTTADGIGWHEVVKTDRTMSAVVVALCGTFEENYVLCGEIILIRIIIRDKIIFH